MARKTIKRYARDWQGQRGQINYVLHLVDDFGGFNNKVQKQACSFKH